MVSNNIQPNHPISFGALAEASAQTGDFNTAHQVQILPMLTGMLKTLSRVLFPPLEVFRLVGKPNKHITTLGASFLWSSRRDGFGSNP
jgi:hypothetical protein